MKVVNQEVHMTDKYVHFKQDEIVQLCLQKMIEHKDFYMIIEQQLNFECIFKTANKPSRRNPHDRTNP